MNKRLVCISVWCCLCAASFKAAAQIIPGANNFADTSKVRISSVNVFGNKRTKGFIVLREIQFKAGDSIIKNKLPENFVHAHDQVFNTNLFTEVKLDSAKLSDSSLRVNVFVKEKWYIYPTPQFQLADRSFNEWIKTYHASLQRVVYGVKFAHYNFSGRHDQLRIYLLNGYARNISVSYSNPYSNRALTAGYGFSTGYTQNREIAVRTSYYNKLLDYRTSGFVRNSFSASGGYSWRKGFFKTVSAGIGISYLNVADSVLNYNPHYFNDSSRHQFFPDFSAAVSYLNTDNNNYPLRGAAYNFSVSKRGIKFKGGLNNTVFQASFSKYIPLGRNWYTSVQSAGILKLPFNEAYINQRALGYGNFLLRGLEYYVVDGVAAGVAKFTLSKKVAAFKIPIPFHIRTIPNIPFKLFAKTYADAGYSYMPEQYRAMLNNKFLYTGGFGLDILTLYNIVFKVEYSFNQLGEKGLFLHGSSGF